MRIIRRLKELILKKHFCEYNRCNSEAEEYILEDWDEVKNQILPVSFWYCPEHAKNGGFCLWCGGFWGGVEFFEVSESGVCENCYDEVKAEFGEYGEGDYPECWYDV